MRPLIKLVATAAVLATLAGCNVMRGEQSAGEYVDDAALTARVKAALLDSEEVSGTSFNVDVVQGTVTLSGTADSAEEAKRAEEIARQVPGVRDVQSTIRVAEAGGEESEAGTTESPEQR